MLNRARVGLLSLDDIKTLKSRLISAESSFMSEKNLCIFPKRSDVAKHNQACQQQLGSQLFTIPAEHYFSSIDSQSGLSCPPEYIPQDDRDAGNIPQILELSVGSRVMLLRNLDVSQGLVNGAMGVVHQIDVNYLGKVQHIHVVFDQVTTSSSDNNQNPVQKPIR